ncbi:molecular chaperone Skp [Siphonobacter sp. BAB-5405]|uniref:OmpH family outer membrane protein n=1 Tax=Siphonobacter sp. BAB-5405 TaxID=1864825 RepID=UPI000C7FE058|nr:OmpH family outer membrane protein [Siphonobacter sp. BAB-5405]PMD93232.1 molecular chaperone Skp [Siphonobacter sp. BAB-5405]
MKNLSLALNAVLVVAVAVLYYLHFKGDSSSSSGSSAAVTADGRAIVYVNADSLLNNYDFFKDTQKAFEQKGTQLDVELNQKGGAIQREIQIFQQRAGGMLAAEAQAKQLELQKKASDFENYRQKAANDLSVERADQTEKLYDNIFEYIKKYNNDNKYQYVLGYQKGGGILFADSKLDITQKMIEGLNKEYKATQPKTEEKKEEKK